MVAARKTEWVTKIKPGDGLARITLGDSEIVVSVSLHNKDGEVEPRAKVAIVSNLPIRKGLDRGMMDEGGRS